MGVFRVVKYTQHGVAQNRVFTIWTPTKLLKSSEEPSNDKEEHALHRGDFSGSFDSLLRLSLYYTFKNY